MSTVWRVAAAALLVAVLGAWFLGRVFADEPPLPRVGDPVHVTPPPGSAPPVPSPSSPLPTPGPSQTDTGDEDSDDDPVRTVTPSPTAVSSDEADDGSD